MDIFRKCVYKSPAQMCIIQTSLDSGDPIVSEISICVDVTLISFQKCFRIFSARSRLVLEISNRAFRIFQATVNPHIRIGSILSSGLFQYLHMGFVDMQIMLFQQFLI